MTWQQFIPMLIVLTVAVVFVWRSSGGKKASGGCNCGCTHDHAEAESKKESTTP